MPDRRGVLRGRAGEPGQRMPGVRDCQQHDGVDDSRRRGAVRCGDVYRFVVDGVQNLRFGAVHRWWCRAVVRRRQDLHDRFVRSGRGVWEHAAGAALSDRGNVFCGRAGKPCERVPGMHIGAGNLGVDERGGRDAVCVVVMHWPDIHDPEDVRDRAVHCWRCYAVVR